jgi:hypothetical protein
VFEGNIIDQLIAVVERVESRVQWPAPAKVPQEMHSQAPYESETLLAGVA